MKEAFVTTENPWASVLRLGAVTAAELFYMWAKSHSGEFGNRWNLWNEVLHSNEPPRSRVCSLCLRELNGEGVLLGTSAGSGRGSAVTVGSENFTDIDIMRMRTSPIWLCPACAAAFALGRPVRPGKKPESVNLQAAPFWYAMGPDGPIGDPLWDRRWWELPTWRPMAVAIFGIAHRSPWPQRHVLPRVEPGFDPRRLSIWVEGRMYEFPVEAQEVAKAGLEKLAGLDGREKSAVVRAYAERLIEMGVPERLAWFTLVQKGEK